jgi:methyltransferase
VLPLVFGLWWIALVFTIANGLLLWIRIREENRALGR